MDLWKATARRDEKRLSFWIWCALYYKFDGISNKQNVLNRLVQDSMSALEFFIHLYHCQTDSVSYHYADVMRALWSLKSQQLDCLFKKSVQETTEQT